MVDSQTPPNPQKISGPQKVSGPQKIWGVVGLLTYHFVGAFLYLPSGLMVPGPWLYLLWAIWVAGAFLAWRTFQWCPLIVLLFAPAALVFWFLFVAAVEQLLGWTA